MTKIIPIVAEKTGVLYEKKLVYLVDQISARPTMAVYNAHMEICRMWKIANENLNLALEAFFKRDEAMAKMVFKNEETIDYLHQNIQAVLADVTNLHLSDNDARKVSDMFVILSEIEQIGDRAENIAEYVRDIEMGEVEFTEVSTAELTVVGDATKQLMSAALTAYQNHDVAALPKIEEMENRIDGMVSEFNKNHFRRLKEKMCKSKSGVIFADTLSDLEKCADSAEKIAFFMEPQGT
jgi:phosphate:Na+ symporter